MAIGSLASGLAQVQAGTLLGLGITGAARNPLLPDVPTFAEAGLPKFNVPYWFALAAPAWNFDKLHGGVRLPRTDHVEGRVNGGAAEITFFVLHRA